MAHLVPRYILLVAGFVLCVRFEEAESMPPRPWNFIAGMSDYDDVRNEKYMLKAIRIDGDGATVPIKQATWNDFRLPNKTVPLHYDIELSTKIHVGKLDFYGNVSIKVHVLEDTNTIILHSLDQTILNASIKRENESTIYELDFQYEAEREFLSLTPKNASLRFQTGQILIIDIEYSSVLRNDQSGFYVSTYRDKSNNVRSLATTQFESVKARHAFPCYDEPAKRATFTITIKHDPSYFAISNMPMDTNKSSTGVTAFQRTVNMPTYLVAFIVSDFKHSKGDMYNVPHQIFSRPGTEYDQEFALFAGMRILESLSEYFSLNYTMPKMDQAAVPDFEAGAMENWGLCIYREETLLYNKRKMDTKQLMIVATVIAHEFTHQWFGDYVTPKWWSFLWLKEGFATVYQYEIIKKVFPEWDFAIMYRKRIWDTMSKDSALGVRSMTYYVQTPDEIGGLYDFVSYDKASAVLTMWQNALSDDVFRQGLHNYLDHNKFGTGEENDLFQAIQLAVDSKSNRVPASIETMMSTWTNQGGYPILTVKRNYENGSFIIYQRPYYDDATYTAPHFWYIPINYATKSNPDFSNTIAQHFMLQTKELIVDYANVPNEDWILLNKQSTGYYRVNYDEKNWALLTQALKESPSHIHPFNRAQLLNDAYTLAVSERLKHSIVMELMTYLVKETEYCPWNIALKIILDMKTYLKSHEMYNKFKKFVGGLVSDIYRKIGFNESPNDSFPTKVIRLKVMSLACEMDVDICLKDTKTKLIDYVRKGVEIETNLRPIVYCHGLKQASDFEFNYIFEELMAADDPSESEMIAKSLGCVQRESLMRKFVESSIDMENNLRKEDRTNIPKGIYGLTEVGWFVCIDFFQKHWKEYDNLEGEHRFDRNSPLLDDIALMSKYANSKHKEQMLLDMLRVIKKDGCIKDIGPEEGIKANVEMNLKWTKDNGNPFMNWFLKSNKTTSRATINVASAAVFIVALIELEF